MFAKFPGRLKPEQTALLPLNYKGRFKESLGVFPNDLAVADTCWHRAALSCCSINTVVINHCSSTVCQNLGSITVAIYAPLLLGSLSPSTVTSAIT